MKEVSNADIHSKLEPNLNADPSHNYEILVKHLQLAKNKHIPQKKNIYINIDILKHVKEKYMTQKLLAKLSKQNSWYVKWKTTPVTHASYELRTECRKLREENVSLMSQANYIESYSRRDNLIIYGIPEVKPESIAQCNNSVREFFVNYLTFTDLEATGIDFIRCHRLYTTRKNAVKPVIVLNLNLFIG